MSESIYSVIHVRKTSCGTFSSSRGEEQGFQVLEPQSCVEETRSVGLEITLRNRYGIYSREVCNREQR